MLVHFQQFAAELQTMGHLAHLVKHSMGPIWDIDRDLSSAQLSEGLGIKHKEESTFFLKTYREQIKCVTLKKEISKYSSNYIDSKTKHLLSTFTVVI